MAFKTFRNTSQSNLNPDKSDIFSNRRAIESQEFLQEKFEPGFFCKNPSNKQRNPKQA